MLGIVLMILKVIGLILLGILGLILALFLILLIFPVVYRVSLSGDSEKPDEFACRVSILGIQLVPKKERTGRKKRQKNQQKQESSEVSISTQVRESGEECSGNHGQQQADTPQNGTASETASKASEAEKPEEQREQQKKKKRQRKNSKEKSPDGKAENIRETLDKLRKELTDESNRRALRHVCSEIGCLFRHCGPRRVRADVSFSLGDPANTGYATAVLSVCPFSYGKGCRIVPDFQTEQLYARARLDMLGYVQLIHVLVIGLRLLFDKDIRKVVQKIRKES